MTLKQGALAALLEAGRGTDELADFHARWQNEPLVIDKWFTLQVMHAAPEKAVEVTRTLTQHPDFNWKNPNRFRALFGALYMNQAGFHDPTGAGYQLFTDWLLRLDPVNPQIAARLSGAFESWRNYDADRQAMMRAQLERIAATQGISPNTGEMVARMLGD